jgi:hypothetical protein
MGEQAVWVQLLQFLFKTDSAQMHVRLNRPTHTEEPECAKNPCQWHPTLKLQDFSSNFLNNHYPYLLKYVLVTQSSVQYCNWPNAHMTCVTSLSVQVQPGENANHRNLGISSRRHWTQIDVSRPHAQSSERREFDETAKMLVGSSCFTISIPIAIPQPLWLWL